MPPLPTLLPKPLDAQSHTPPAPAIKQVCKRKRGTHHTACNYCRARREKCSGLRPRCQTCERYGAQCVYEAPQGVTRQQAYKQKLADVERSTSSLRGVVELLRHGSETDAAVALSRIRQAENIDEAVNVLAGAQALLTSTSSTARIAPGSTSQHNDSSNKDFPSRPTKLTVTSPTEHPEYMFEKGFAQARDRYNEDDVFIDLPALNFPLSRWTSACKDDRLMNHLLTLFWTWDNGVERALFRPLFEEDLYNDDPQTVNIEGQAFCSPFLVNALLALGCLFTTEHVTFSDPEDPKSRGRRFAEEAERHFEKEKKQPSIPLLQGQFAMFVYEGNLGVGTKSVDYFMRTMETYGALNNPDFLNPQSRGKSEGRLQRDKEGLSWVMWGLYCAEWRASQAFGFRKPTAKPLIPKLWRSSTFPLSQPNSACYWWFPYPVSMRTQRSMKVEIREADSHLSEIAEDVLDFLYPLPHGPCGPPITNPQRAVELYNTLVQWKLSLPARLRLDEAVQPSAILLHSYVEVLLIGTLRPFLHFTNSQFGPFTPKDRCYTHCTSLMDTIWTFRAFVSLNGEHGCIHTLATIVFVTLREHADSPVQIETLIKACKCLHELTAVFPLAVDALSAIRGAFKIAGMQLPTYLKPFLGPAVRHRRDGLLHHTAAAIMPSADRRKDTRGELRYQELLDELDDIGLD